MTRALRIVLIASLLSMLTAVAGVAPAGAAAPTISSISALTTEAGCARMSNATVQCAGLNTHAQLGNGTLTNSLVPVVVKNTSGTGSLTGVAQVVTGYYYACARLTNGTVDCWGDNTYGQLGNGSKGATGIATPVRSSTGTGPLTGVVQIAAGKYHTCARLSNGTVACWGHNGYYELGNGSNLEHLLPVLVRNGNNSGPLTGEVSISVGQYDSCAVNSDGSARCWGLNQFGILGNGNQRASALPARIKGVNGKGFLVNVSSIAAAPQHTCALLRNKTVDCWGFNGMGQVGNGTTVTRLSPVVVRNTLGNAALVNVAQLTVGGGSDGDHSCVRIVNSTAMCWGSNNFGQLGVGTKNQHLRPAVVVASTGGGALTNVLGVFAGPISTCAVIKGGNAKCWGFNQGGQFGNGSAHNATRPIPAKP
jgi:alpha-tubulin suppressor-like RCC1 family protein